MEEKFYYRIEAEAGTAYDVETHTDHPSYVEITIALSEGESYEEVHHSEEAKQQAILSYLLTGMNVSIEHVTPITEEEYDDADVVVNEDEGVSNEREETFYYKIQPQEGLDYEYEEGTEPPAPKYTEITLSLDPEDSYDAVHKDHQTLEAVVKHHEEYGGGHIELRHLVPVTKEEYDTAVADKG